MTTTTASVIKETLLSLKEINYRNGFNETVLTHLCNAIREKMPDPSLADQLWSDGVCFPSSSPSRNEKILSFWLDNDQELYDLMVEVHRMAKGKGCFEMPSWGTYGT